MDLYRIAEQKLYYFGYSENTIKTYLNYIHEFEKKVSKHYSRLNAKDVQSYLDSYNFSSTSKQNQVISALKFAWEKGLDRKYLKINFARPKKEKKLPRIIDQKELVSKIKAIKNNKHKAIIWLAFSTGMRVSEVISLKISDIDSERMIIHVRNAKGRKDRIVKLTDGTLKTLREYFKEYRPKANLFNGQSSQSYSSTSCNKIVKKYIGDDCHFHLLRHAFACSVLENGTDIHKLKEVLGHNSIKTSENYLHLTKNAIHQIAAPI